MPEQTLINEDQTEQLHCLALARMVISALFRF
ncbi:hypothetical protein L916_17938 [Phytophthora nicotianae]|uniref:Uncharacterized protein n=1 Tax=Phytophthora nicotianae TaxID=4792 RepID=W2I5P6_PHYNI|nr:hypothetical protein L916_17938 [Phytophthora nicotianae]